MPTRTNERQNHGFQRKITDLGNCKRINGRTAMNTPRKQKEAAHRLRWFEIFAKDAGLEPQQFSLVMCYLVYECQATKKQLGIQSLEFQRREYFRHHAGKACREMKSKAWKTVTSLGIEL